MFFLLKFIPLIIIFFNFQLFKLVLDDNYETALEAGLRNYKIRAYGVIKLKPNFILETYYQISYQ